MGPKTSKNIGQMPSRPKLYGLATNLRVQRSCSQVVEIACAAGVYTLDPASVNDFVIRIPERNAGEIFGEDLLDSDVIFAPRNMIFFYRSIPQELIDAGIRIVTAISSLRRKAAGAVGIAKDVGVFIAANPTQGVDLKCSSGYVRVEGPKFS